MIKTYTVNGFTGNLAQIAEHFKINEKTLRSRLKSGMSIEEAVNTPINESKSKSKVYTVDGFTGTIPKIAKHFEINEETLRGRLRNGMSIEEAVNTPIKKTRSHNSYTVDDFTGTLNEIAEHFKINRTTIKSRLKKGMSIEEAVNTTKYTVDGFTGTILKIAEHFKINEGTLRSRLKKGMSLEEAIGTPVKKQDRTTVYTVDDFTGTISEITNHFEIKITTIYNRLKKGMTIEEAVSIPLQKIQTKDIKYNGEVGDLRYFCKKYNKDYVEVYNKLKHLHTLEYALESTTKPYNE